MSSNLMLDLMNPSMSSKEVGDISIDQDGEWGKIHFLDISTTTWVFHESLNAIKKSNA